MKKRKGGVSMASNQGCSSTFNRAVLFIAGFMLIYLAVHSFGFAQDSIADLATGRTQMIGQPAPEWKLKEWVNSPGLEIDQLLGKVILLRFFSDQPAGASSIVDLDREFRGQGLVTVGVYAPSPMPTQVPASQVKRLAAAMGFNFPVGVDSSWATVNRYWLDRADANMTAVTFLIDRKGVIRYIQPDGGYGDANRKGRREFDSLKRQIQTLIKEDAAVNETDAAKAGSASGQEQK